MVSMKTRQLLKETIIDELQVLPELLKKVERQYYRIELQLTELRGTALGAESGAAGAALESRRDELRQLEDQAIQLKTEVDFLQRRMENYRLIAKLLC